MIRLKQEEHIRAERQILSLIDHPFIVILYQTYQDPRNLFLLLEYVYGGEVFTDNNYS